MAEHEIPHVAMEGQIVVLPLSAGLPCVLRVIWRSKRWRDVAGLALYDSAGPEEFLDAGHRAYRLGFAFCLGLDECLQAVRAQVIPGPSLDFDEERLPVFHRTSGLYRRDAEVRSCSRNDEERFKGLSLALSAASLSDDVLKLLGMDTSPIDKSARELTPERSASTRCWAAVYVGKLGRAAAPLLPMLCANARDRNRNVRRTACHAIGNVGVDSPEAIAALEAACEDEHEEVRLAARESLTLLPGGIGIRGLNDPL